MRPLLGLGSFAGRAAGVFALLLHLIQLPLAHAGVCAVAARELVLLHVLLAEESGGLPPAAARRRQEAAANGDLEARLRSAPSTSGDRHHRSPRPTPTFAVCDLLTFYLPGSIFIR